MEELLKTIKITSTTVEGFTTIREKLSTLPNEVLEQIESAAHSVIGIECIIKYKHNSKQRIYLPDNVTQISDFDDYIGIYADKFFFTLRGHLYKDTKLDYVILSKK